MKTVLAWLSWAVVAVAAPTWQEEFEAGRVAPERWSPSGRQAGGAVVTQEVPAYAGQRCLRIEVRPGDNRMVGRQGNATERFELTLREAQLRLGEEIWYSFAWRIPEDFPTAPTRTIIHQFKENVRPRPAGLPAGTAHCEKASPMFALYLQAGRRLVAMATSSTACDHTRHVLGERQIEPGRWYRITVRARPAHDAAGRLEVYCDDTLLGTYTGILGYVCHGLGYIDTQPRFGIYRDAHAAAGVARIYYDAIRFGRTYADVQRE